MFSKFILNNYALAIVTIFGFACTVFTTFYKQKKRVCAMYKSVKIENSKKLKINRKEYNDLNLANIIIWNSGKKVIKNSDTTKISPLRIEGCSPTTDIINCEMLFMTNEYNNVSIEKIDDSYIINFDFLEPKDGCAIQVIYNGESDGVRVDGKIIDGVKISKPWSHNNKLQNILEGNLFKKILACDFLFFVTIFFVGIMFPIAFLQSANYGRIPVNLTGFDKSVVTVILDILFIITEFIISLYILVWICIFRYHCLPPKELQNYVR